MIPTGSQIDDACAQNSISINQPMKKILLKTALAFSTAASPFLGAQTEINPRLSTDEIAPINPYIYGQFIEHLGRCIYGGIWAEMLEDRKFYHPVSPDYDPYGDQILADPDFPGVIDATEFPVVSGSPWEIIGNVDGLKMVTQGSFVGRHTPRIKAGTAIRQHDLGVVEGMNYPGYLWVKPLGGDAELEVTLTWGQPQTDAASTRIHVDGNNSDYVKKSFEFVAKNTVAMGATLTVSVVKGEVLLGTLSLMPGDNVHGMRSDTLDLLRELDSPLYRWPGGNFVSGYNWRDGIGDRDRRPPRRNPAWTGVEHNDFGTDEFLLFCRLIGAEPMIAANTGFGDSYSAAQWVEYTNGDTSTIGGSWRAQNGHKEPYGVRYWCVGNEMWGNWQLGHMQLHHYVLKHNEFAEAMLDADSNLVLIASGDLERINHGTDPVQSRRGIPWTEGMLLDSSNYMDMISEHFYAGRTPWSETGRVALTQHIASMQNSIRTKAEGHRVLQTQLEHLDDRIIPIAMTEWNYWHRDYAYGELGCIYDLADGLGTAAGLHEYFRHTDIIEMALYAQTVNVIGAIKTTRISAEIETTGLALSMYRKHFGKFPLKVEGVEGPFDVSAAMTEDGQYLTIGVINLTTEMALLNPEIAGVQVTGSASRWHFSGEDEFAYNAPGQERSVDIKHAVGLDLSQGLEVPALSAAIFVLPLATAAR